MGVIKSPHKQSLSLEWVGDQVSLITFGLLGAPPDWAENSGLVGWLRGRMETRSSQFELKSVENLKARLLR